MKNKRAYINGIKLEILERLEGYMEFDSGLTIVSGENGTLKTHLLRDLKRMKTTSTAWGTPHVLAFSPKRNAERKNFQQTIDKVRSENGSLDMVLSRRLGAALNDASFEEYPTFAELFHLNFLERRKDGGDQIKHMDELGTHYGGLVSKIFPDYKLVANWDDKAGAPILCFEKPHAGTVPVEGLSLGEKEVLSLIATLDAARERCDVFLIDEPEVHLNWHLEYQLFAYLKELAEDGHQVIVVTHSRTVFRSEFRPHLLVLSWNCGKVEWSNQLSEQLYDRLVGDFANVVQVGDPSVATFFVEDSFHELAVREIAAQLKMRVFVSRCENSQNVKSLHRKSVVDRWSNCFFLVDGDNQGNPFPDSSSFVHLDLYSLENYFLNLAVCAGVLGVTKDALLNDLVGIIQDKRDQFVRKNKFYHFVYSLIDKLASSDLDESLLGVLDGSIILPALLDKYSIDRDEFVRMAVAAMAEKGVLREVFPSKLIAGIEGSQAT